MSQKRRVKRRPGDVIAVPLGSGRLAFGLVLEERLVAFFDGEAGVGAEPPLEELVRWPVAFRVWVMNQPIKDGSWPVIGRAPIPTELRELPSFFKQDAISKKVTITRTGAEERTPEPGEAESLEPAAVWSANHIEDRLRDHLAGRPNVWRESLRLK